MGYLMDIHGDWIYWSHIGFVRSWRIPPPMVTSRSCLEENMVTAEPVRWSPSGKKVTAEPQLRCEKKTWRKHDLTQVSYQGVLRICHSIQGTIQCWAKNHAEKKNICSRHPIKASSQSIKGNPRPMSKVPVLTLEFHDLFWSQRKDISEMLRLCSFRLTRRMWTHTDEFESCHVAWEICMYIYIYIWLFMCTKQSL